MRRTIFLVATILLVAAGCNKSGQNTNNGSGAPVSQNVSSPASDRGTSQNSGQQTAANTPAAVRQPQKPVRPRAVPKKTASVASQKTKASAAAVPKIIYPQSENVIVSQGMLTSDNFNRFSITANSVNDASADLIFNQSGQNQEANLVVNGEAAVFGYSVTLVSTQGGQALIAITK